MTPANSTTRSTDASSPNHPAYDVAVVVGGPAGCSAAVFTARADLETVLFEHDRASLLKSAHLENYLGFPFGIQPTQFLELAHEHIREVGCDIHQEGVIALRALDGGGEQVEFEDGETTADGVAVDHTFTLETTERTVAADRVVVASWARTEFLESLPVTREPEAPGPVMVVPTDEDGRTDCDGVYAAVGLRAPTTRRSSTPATAPTSL